MMRTVGLSTKPEEIMSKVDIILPSYNHQKYIECAIDSVLNQSYQNWELWISDDASPDETMSVIGKYSDKRIKLIHRFERNQGAGLNTRFLLEHCRNEYVALINSDDVWLEKHLEESVNYLETHSECAAVFSWADLIDEDGTIIKHNCDVFRQKNRTKEEWLRYFFENGNCICHPSMVIRRQILEDIGYYSMPMRQLPDFWTWINLVKRHEIHVLSQVLVQHRRGMTLLENTSAVTPDNAVRDANEALYILMHYFDDVSDEAFKKAFHPLFRRKGASSAEQLLCERFFLIADGHFYIDKIHHLAAMHYFIEHCNSMRILDVFQNEYHYSINDFYTVGTQNDLVGYRMNLPSANQNIHGIRQGIKRLLGDTAVLRIIKKIYRLLR